jgi:segregation and condensation protein B
MEREEIKSILESLLFVADGPLTVQRFVEVLDGVDKETIQALILELQSELEAPSRGLQLVEVAGGYQLRTAKINADWVKKFLGGRPARMGRATLETLPTASRLPKRRSNRSAVSTSTA